MTLEKDRPQATAPERTVHILVAAAGADEARRLHAVLEAIPAFRVHGVRDVWEAAALLETRPFDAAIIGGSAEESAEFVSWLKSEHPEIVVLPASTLESGDVETLALQIHAAVREAEAARHRETMVRWLEQESRVDQLTGLYNRKTFSDRLDEVCEAAFAAQSPVTLIMVDVVGTRLVNDSHGREAGDSLIQRAAVGNMRSIRGTDFAARVDGDDFAILLPQADFELGQRIARRLAHELERLNGNEWQGQVPVEVSFGVATGVECTGIELFEAAMNELSRCKNPAFSPAAFPRFDGPDDPSVA